MKTFVYVDAFNLYYGAAKDTPYKWLDLQALCRIMIPKNTVACIKYFTARVQPRPGDPDQPTRQLMYLRALQTLPNLQIVYGHYLSHVVWMPIAFSLPGQKPFHKTVGVLNPQKKPCKALQVSAHFYKHIREAALQASQFPPILTDRQGTFHKPSSW